jgi:hypothetical protein
MSSSSSSSSQRVKRTKYQCAACKQSIVDLDKHKCHGGTCPDCGSTYNNLRTHSCCLKSLARIEQIDADDVLIETVVRPYVTIPMSKKKSTMAQCDECRRMVWSSKNNNYKWRGQTICRTCNDDPVKIAIRDALFQRINNHYLSQGVDQCQICHVKCIDAITRKMIHAFHSDHVSTRGKELTLMTIAREGCDEKTIDDELSKCRLLCVYCHEVVTMAQTITGEINMIKQHNRVSCLVDEKQKEQQRQRAEKQSIRVQGLLFGMSDETKRKWLDDIKATAAAAKQAIEENDDEEDNEGNDE